MEESGQLYALEASSLGEEAAGTHRTGGEFSPRVCLDAVRIETFYNAEDRIRAAQSVTYGKIKKKNPRNRPWRPIGL
jgi:hypothetical protein